MLSDIEGWGAPERMGLRRAPETRTIVLRTFVALLLIAAIAFGLGALGAFGNPL